MTLEQNCERARIERESRVCEISVVEEREVTGDFARELRHRGARTIDIELDDWDKLGCDIPCLVNLMPSGKYLMEDFYYAGGIPAVIRELGDLLHKDAMTVNGSTRSVRCGTR